MIGNQTRIVTDVAECFSCLRHPVSTTTRPLCNILPLHLSYIQYYCIIK